MRTDPAAAGNALDGRGLDALRTRAANDPRAAAREAAVQFETLFMQMAMRGMREASGTTGGSQAQDTFTGMLDQQFARQFAGRPGGLARMLEQQLSRHMGNLPPLSPANQAAAAAATAGTGAAAPANPRAAAFVADMLPHAQEAERRTGVPASFILGQAALESGWGRGEPRMADGGRSYNLFGIKAGGGWTGATARAPTTEFVDGQAVRQDASFRAYGSYADAFTDYARLLAGQPRYAQVLRTASTPEAFAAGMQRAGYATDPQYASKLARTINSTLALQRAMG